MARPCVTEMHESPLVHPQEEPTQTAGSPEELGQRLNTLFNVARILARESDLERMLPSFLSALIETIPAADAGVILLYEPYEGRLIARSSLGLPLAILQELRLVPGEAMSGKVFASGRAELYLTPEATAAAMADLTPENRAIYEAATTGLSQPQAAICVPLAQGENKVGTLILQNLRQFGRFTLSDLAFLQAVADLIALAIIGAQLAEDLQAERAFSEANRLKAELLSILAHEMRTPLTSIKGYSTALLMEEAHFAPETQREFLHIIDEECDTLQDLIHDLLESSIIDAGLLKLEPQPVLLHRLVREVLDDMAHRSRNHRFLVDIPQDFPIIEADPLRIMQVLRNLLDNAVKYSPQGGLVVVRGQVCSEEVIVSVADQGVGIAPEDLNRLFEKFFRARTGLGRNVVGSGLGLPIARTIVESHAGRIWAESKVGEGTTLYFALPLTRMGQEAELA
jgi:signal transduction histidine kinase